jgi:hypothetical protein
VDDKSSEHSAEHVSHPRRRWSVGPYCAAAGCALAWVTIIISAGVLLSNEAQRRSNESGMCLSNMKVIGMAIQMYAEDHDKRMPPAEQWMDRIADYKSSSHVLHCPTALSAHPGAYGYAFDSRRSCRKLGSDADQARTILAYDSTKLGRNETDPGQSMPMPGRHGEGNFVAYADGHSKWLRESSTGKP